MNIRMENIRKNYTESGVETNVLQGVDLDVKSGEMVSVMGASGSGKSTLLYIIAGLEQASSGKLYADDREMIGLKKSEADHYRRGHIGMVFQQFALVPYYTVFENVELPLRVQGVSRRERKDKVMELLRSLGIEELCKKRPSKLSGGEQQRCAIARAIAASDDLILADEPTGALDRNTGYEVMGVLRS